MNYVILNKNKKLEFHVGSDLPEFGFELTKDDYLALIDGQQIESQPYQQWLEDGNTPEPAGPAPAPDYSAMRAQAYRDESDPLFFKAQRGEATNQEWLDKVAEIKARWPE